MHDRFQIALEAVMKDLSAMPELTGILFFGSVQRGEGTATSDLDLYAITNGELQWLSGRVVHGVEIELHFCPAQGWADRLNRGSAVITNAFATGSILLDRTGDTAALVALGKRLWSEGPYPLSPWQVTTWRYRVSDLSRDLEALSMNTPEARLVAGELVPLALEAYFALNSRWAPKHTQTINHVSNHDPALGQAVVEFYELAMDPGKAIAIADRVLAPFGGRILTYESTPVPLNMKP